MYKLDVRHHDPLGDPLWVDPAVLEAAVDVGLVGLLMASSFELVFVLHDDLGGEEADCFRFSSVHGTLEIWNRTTQNRATARNSGVASLRNSIISI